MISYNKILLTSFIAIMGFALFGQNAIHKTSIIGDCDTDFWTITADGYIQQWSLLNGVITGGDTVLSGGGLSLAYCGKKDSPTFYTDNWNPGVGINYYDPDSGWINIPTLHHVQDNGGHLDDQYFTVVGGVIQYVNYWNGTNLVVIDSMHGEFFAGIFDIGVDISGQAWIFTASSPGTAVDSLKVYDKTGRINSYPIQFDMQGYGSFFLNETLYLGTLKDSIYPVIINGSSAQIGNGIPFQSKSFTDMASCQVSKTTDIPDLSDPEIYLYPNPTRNYSSFNIDIDKHTIWVYNSTGQLIEHKLDGNLLDLTEQSSGVYYLKINKEGRSKYFKVMKF